MDCKKLISSFQIFCKENEFILRGVLMRVKNFKLIQFIQSHFQIFIDDIKCTDPTDKNAEQN